MKLRIPSTKRALCGPCTSAHPHTKDFYVRQGRRVSSQVINHPSLSIVLSSSVPSASPCLPLGCLSTDFHLESFP